MITGILINKERQFSDFYVNTKQLSSVYAQGYNFKLLTNVLLSTNYNSFFNNLTSVKFTRQPTISGVLIPFKIVNNNILQFILPYVDLNDASVETVYVDIIPFNKAGYSSACRSLNPRIYPESTTLIKFYQSANKYMLVDELGNIFKTETGDTLISNNGDTITDSQGNIILNGDINIIQTP